MQESPHCVGEIEMAAINGYRRKRLLVQMWRVTDRGCEVTPVFDALLPSITDKHTRRSVMKHITNLNVVHLCISSHEQRLYNQNKSCRLESSINQAAIILDIILRTFF